MTHPVTGRPLGLVARHEVGSDMLRGMISKYCHECGVDIDSLVEHVGDLMELPVFGSFQPSCLGVLDDEFSLNSALFYTTVILKIKSEAVTNHYFERPQIVFHPDILYFTSMGSRENMKIAAKVWENTFGFVGVKGLLENPYLISKAYKVHFSWLQDPDQLIGLLPLGSTSLGICLDAKHLEELGYGADEIGAKLSRVIKSGVPAALHVDSNWSVNDPGRPYFYTAYKNGIPVAYEERLLGGS